MLTPYDNDAVRLAIDEAARAAFPRRGVSVHFDRGRWEITVVEREPGGVHRGATYTVHDGPVRLTFAPLAD